MRPEAIPPAARGIINPDTGFLFPKDQRTETSGDAGASGEISPRLRDARRQVLQELRNTSGVTEVTSSQDEAAGRAVFSVPGNLSDIDTIVVENLDDGVMVTATGKHGNVTDSLAVREVDGGLTYRTVNLDPRDRDAVTQTGPSDTPLSVDFQFTPQRSLRIEIGEPIGDDNREFFDRLLPPLEPELGD